MVTRLFMYKRLKRDSEPVLAKVPWPSDGFKFPGVIHQKLALGWALARMMLSTLPVPIAIHQMIIDHPRGLHKRIANGGADEVEAALFERPAHGLRFGRRCRDFCQVSPLVDPGLAIDKTP